MFGSAREPGIAYRALQQIMGISTQDGTRSDGGNSVKVSILEIYNEEVFDLLASHSATTGAAGSWKASPRASPTRARLEVMGRKVKNATSITGSDPEKVAREIATVEKRRVVKSTSCNDRSSRSHCMVIVDVPAVGGRLMLVDMAGSENIDQAGPGIETKLQTGKINQGNVALKRVVEAIANGDSHIPYRDSKLTMLLQDSFEDDKAKILMVLCTSPDPKFFHRTIGTLEYGAKAKGIVRLPKSSPAKEKGALEGDARQAARTLALELDVEKLRQESQEQDKKRIEMENQYFSTQQEMQSLRTKLAKIEGERLVVVDRASEQKWAGLSERLEQVSQKMIADCKAAADRFVKGSQLRYQELIGNHLSEMTVLHARVEQIEMQVLGMQDCNLQTMLSEFHPESAASQGNMEDLQVTDRRNAAHNRFWKVSKDASEDDKSLAQVMQGSRMWDDACTTAQDQHPDQLNSKMEFGLSVSAPVSAYSNGINSKVSASISTSCHGLSCCLTGGNASVPPLYPSQDHEDSATPCADRPTFSILGDCGSQDSTGSAASGDFDDDACSFLSEEEGDEVTNTKQQRVLTNLTRSLLCTFSIEDNQNEEPAKACRFGGWLPVIPEEKELDSDNDHDEREACTEGSLEKSPVMASRTLGTSMANHASSNSYNISAALDDNKDQSDHASSPAKRQNGSNATKVTSTHVAELNDHADLQEISVKDRHKIGFNLNQHVQSLGMSEGAIGMKDLSKLHENYRQRSETLNGSRNIANCISDQNLETRVTMWSKIEESLPFRNTTEHAANKHSHEATDIHEATNISCQALSCMEGKEQAYSCRANQHESNLHREEEGTTVCGLDACSYARSISTTRSDASYSSLSFSSEVPATMPCIGQVTVDDQNSATEKFQEDEENLGQQSKQSKPRSDMCDVYAKWETSRESSQGVIKTLCLEKTAKLADLRKLLQPCVSEREQDFTFLMLGEPGGALVEKAVEPELQVASLPIWENQKGSHLACLRPRKGLFPAPAQKYAHPFRPLENQIAKTLLSSLPHETKSKTRQAIEQRQAYGMNGLCPVDSNPADYVHDLKENVVQQ